MAKATAAIASPEAIAKPTGIVIRAPKYQITQVKVIGTAPLIVNAVPQKLLNEWEQTRATEQVVDRGNKKQKTYRPARDYEDEFRNSLYPIDGMEGVFGFPAMGFKHSLVGAVRQVNGLDMTTAKRLMFVMSDGQSRGFNVVRIIGSPEMRRDMVRLKNVDRTPDIRFRGGFFPWACVLRIEHNVEILSVESLLNLIVIAGRSDGVGEHRPSSGTSGDNGTYRIAEKGE